MTRPVSTRETPNAGGAVSGIELGHSQLISALRNRTSAARQQRPPLTRRTRPSEPDSAKSALSFSVGHSFVYFIATNDLVKIGYTTDIRNRLSCLGRRPADLLAVISGGRDEEMAYHERFRSARTFGREYFRPTADLIECINDIRELAGVPPIHARSS